MKLKKKDYLNILIILSIFLLYLIVIYLKGYTLGSMVDWPSQHFTIPEYLRTLFYEKKALIPNFAFSLGGGQNIYYLTYHGLFNPLIILSYLLPFIKMSTYIICLNIAIVILDAILMYKWLSNHFSKKITFLSTFIFILACPIIYHSHRHLMFTSYMPFLLLALSGVDTYFKNKKKLPLIIWTTLIISISYLYSVGCIITISIYALYVYLKTTKKVTIKNTIKEGLKFVSILIVPILLTLFITLPTFYTLINGRSASSVVITLKDLLLPSTNIKKLFYDSYGIGLPLIVLFSMINNIITKEKKDKYLNITLILFLFIPLFNYLLNGFMYIDAKSLIPLLPLYIYTISTFIQSIKENNYHNLTTIITLLITIILVIKAAKPYTHFLLIDFIVVTITIYLYKKKNNYYILLIPLLLISITNFISINATEKLVPRSYLKELETETSITPDFKKTYERSTNNLISAYNSNNVPNTSYLTTSIYSSVENPYYTKFIKETFTPNIESRHYHELTTTNDLLFNLYMGVKYQITNHPLYGYTKVKDKVYETSDNFSIGYSTNNLMSTKEFNTLTYPYNIDALLNYTIVDKNIENTYKTNINPYTEKISINNINYKEENNNYIFNIEKDTTIKVPINIEENKLLLISFDMNYAPKCASSCSSTITINNVSNTLSGRFWKYNNKNNTFHYTISNIKNKELEITLSKGHYEISNINLYTMDYSTIKNIKHNNLNITNYNGNTIEGTIKVQDEGYFSVSIPYDKGFKIYDNNKEVNYELVNTSFIGFPINKGTHTIKLVYTPPLSKISKTISIITLITLVTIIIYKRKKDKIKWKK